MSLMTLLGSSGWLFGLKSGRSGSSTRSRMGEPACGKKSPSRSLSSRTLLRADESPYARPGRRRRLRWRSSRGSLTLPAFTKFLTGQRFPLLDAVERGAFAKALEVHVHVVRARGRHARTILVQSHEAGRQKRVRHGPPPLAPAVPRSRARSAPRSRRPGVARCPSSHFRPDRIAFRPGLSPTARLCSLPPGCGPLPNRSRDPPGSDPRGCPAPWQRRRRSSR